MGLALTGIEELISTDPAYRGGRPHIAGTRVSVAWIGDLWREGLTAEEMVREVFDGALSLAQVHAALAFYHQNRDAIDADSVAMDTQYDQRAADPNADS